MVKKLPTTFYPCVVEPCYVVRCGDLLMIPFSQNVLFCFFRFCPFPERQTVLEVWPSGCQGSKGIPPQHRHGLLQLPRLQITLNLHLKQSLSKLILVLGRPYFTLRHVVSYGVLPLPQVQQYIYPHHQAGWIEWLRWRFPATRPWHFSGKACTPCLSSILYCFCSLTQNMFIYYLYILLSSSVL